MALGIFNWGIYFGYGLSYVVGNFVTAADINGKGWRWSYIVGGLMGILATMMLLNVQEPTRKSQPAAKQKSLDNDIPSSASIEGSQTCHSELEIEEHPKTVMDKNPKIRNPKGKCSQYMDSIWKGDSGLKEVLKALCTPSMLVIALAAGVRHTAGFSWAYNTQLYFLTYYPEFNLGLWVSGCSILGGSLGVAVGGFVSDRLVKRLGLRARLYVLAGSQLLATPFATGVLYFAPPWAFLSLLGAYLFAEMWFGVLFAVIIELVPGTVQSSAIAVFLFVMNNVGGNLPVLVDPLSHILSYRGALIVMYPGGYLLSSLIFFLASFLL
ncbi:hypothetical protein SK128_005206 [Halocaridina rubra]|uniref:Major facilitator superfamily (MFS) profile domain-containing protein n=1 Tax=Halocaridina rubra TaxID=373956 RepID=A0AAN8WMS9_HALRR